MKIAAIADTHGVSAVIIQGLKQLKPDNILFAGDYYKDGLDIMKQLNIKGYIVAGNCDVTKRVNQEEKISLLNYQILLVHGHQYGVKRDLNRLYYYSRELGVDAVVFGHTHTPMCEQIHGLWMINPGSPSRPRIGTSGTFAVIDIDEKGFHPRILTLPVPANDSNNTNQ